MFIYDNLLNTDEKGTPMNDESTFDLLSDFDVFYFTLITNFYNIINGSWYMNIYIFVYSIEGLPT